MHVVGHAAPPLHTNGLHDGDPAAPGLEIVHVPFALAPSACAQTSQLPPLHAVLQQKPSTHPPALAHSRQGGDAQSFASLHAAACAFSGWHVPFFAQ